MKVATLLLLALVSVSWAHTPGQLNKYYNYYKLAHTITKRTIKNETADKAKKTGELVCIKITKKFSTDPNYKIACEAGVADGLDKTLRNKEDLEGLLHEIDLPPEN